MDAVSFVHAYFRAYALEDVRPQPKSQDKNRWLKSFLSFLVVASFCLINISCPADSQLIMACVVDL